MPPSINVGGSSKVSDNMTWLKIVLGKGVIYSPKSDKVCQPFFFPWLWFLSLTGASQRTIKLVHWKSHSNFFGHWKDTEITLKILTKETTVIIQNNLTEIFSFAVQGHWKILKQTETFSALLISFVPRFFSITLDFQCDFQCQNLACANTL